jgi:hypothetical protein
LSQEVNDRSIFVNIKDLNAGIYLLRIDEKRVIKISIY